MLEYTNSFVVFVIYCLCVLILALAPIQLPTQLVLGAVSLGVKEWA
jgi:hypothetical protein